MPNPNREPTERMIIKLKECAEKEANRKFSLLTDIDFSLTGLYKRGYVASKMVKVDHKKLLAIYVTESGKNFLKKNKEEEIMDV